MKLLALLLDVMGALKCWPVSRLTKAAQGELPSPAQVSEEAMEKGLEIMSGLDDGEAADDMSERNVSREVTKLMAGSKVAHEFQSSGPAIPSKPMVAVGLFRACAPHKRFGAPLAP